MALDLPRRPIDRGEREAIIDAKEPAFAWVDVLWSSSIREPVSYNCLLSKVDLAGKCESSSLSSQAGLVEASF